MEEQQSTTEILMEVLEYKEKQDALSDVQKIKALEIERNKLLLALEDATFLWEDTRSKLLIALDALVAREELKIDNPSSPLDKAVREAWLDGYVNARDCAPLRPKPCFFDALINQGAAIAKAKGEE